MVLWEDSRARCRGFGPHELLCALVADREGASVWEVRNRLRCVPLNGISNLLMAIRDLQRWKRKAPGGARVIAIFDEDRIRAELGLPIAASNEEISASIRSRCDQPERLAIVLLRRNVESLILAAKKCDQENTLSSVAITKALRKDLSARDWILTNLAMDPAKRALRDCMRKEVPSIEEAVSAAAA